MKTKLNNILNANTWLFIELVIITVVAWAVFDPAVVNLYYRSLPLGYDNGQLLYAETEVNGSWSEVIDGVPQDPYEMTEKRRDQILRQLTSVEGVESACLYEQDYGAMGYSRPSFRECVAGGDTLYLGSINFSSDAHFFETYGLKPLPGSPSAAELSRLSYQEQQVVLTRSGAIALFGTADVVGRRLTISSGNGSRCGGGLPHVGVQHDTLYHHEAPKATVHQFAIRHPPEEGTECPALCGGARTGAHRQRTDGLQPHQPPDDLRRIPAAART